MINGRDVQKLVDVLDRRQDRAGDVEEAAIVSANDDQTYMVRNLRTGAIVRASKSNPTDTFPVDTWVLIARMGASGRIRGGGYMILSAAEQQQRGLSGVQSTDDSSVSAPEVMNLVPYPLILDAGGAAGEQDIYGHDFTLPATFSDPGITNNIPQTVTLTQITTHPKAASTVTPGDYDVTVHGKTFPAALRVRPVGGGGGEIPGGETAYLMVFSGNDGGFYLIAAADLNIVTAVGPWLPSTLEPCAGLYASDTHVYGRTRTGFQRIVKGTWSRDVNVSSLTPAFTNNGLAWWDNQLVTAEDASTDPWRALFINPDGTGETGVEIDPTDPEDSRAIWSDGAALYISQFQSVYRYDSGAWTPLHFTPGVGRVLFLAGNATDLYAATALGKIIRVDRATFTVVSTATFASFYTSPFRGILWDEANSRLVVRLVTQVTGADRTYMIAVSDALVELFRVNVYPSNSSGSMATKGGYLFVTHTGDGEIQKLDLIDFTQAVVNTFPTPGFIVSV